MGTKSLMKGSETIALILVILSGSSLIALLYWPRPDRHQRERLASIGNGRGGYWKEGALLVLLLVALTACGGVGETPPCGNAGFVLAPTATRPADPDLSQPPAPPPDTDDTEYCPTPTPATTPETDAPTAFVATDVANLALDPAGQELAAAAVGDDMMAIAWLEGADIYVALSRGGGHFQVRQVDEGESVSVSFSRANRLHMVYARSGRLYYRAADQGTHPADVDAIPVDDAVYPVVNAANPRVVVDAMNWAHVLYAQDGNIYHAKHLSGSDWYARFVAYGTDLSVIPFYNEKELVFYGAPTGTYWFGLILAAPHDGQLRLFRYFSWLNHWVQVAGFPLPAGEDLRGPAGLDFHAVSEDEAWVVASWVTFRDNTAPPVPRYAQPVYEAANPLYPTQIANPHHIYHSLNAVRWHSAGVPPEAAPFSAGLKQTVSVPDPAGTVHFEAYGLLDAPAGATASLRLGIDPTGGDNPESPDVAWTAPAAPGSFNRLSLDVPAAGNTATLFLHGTVDTEETPTTVVWDAATAGNADLANGSFEGAFVAQSTLTVPENWSAYYRDASNEPITGRDTYTAYAAWSADGGSTWSAPVVVTANRDQTGATTGALGPDVFPLVATDVQTPTVSFFYVYESGDPPPGTDFLRFGRPVMTTCALGTDDCTDPPGTPLLPRPVVRPSLALRLAPDPFHPARALMVWDALQTDYARHDIYATTVVAR